jgi:hypothetical protein
MSLMPTQTPDEPFQWGSGGRRMTPEQIAQQQQIAASLMQVDYSPIASPWQGLARVSQNVLGALQNRQAGKAQDANRAESSSVLQALLAGGDKPDPAALTSAALNPYLDETARKFAGTQLSALNKPAAAPHYWETNNGSLAVVGPDGKPQVVYEDPTPKIEWITTTNPDGTKTLVPMQQGDGPSSTPPISQQRPPIGAVVADPFGDGGQTPPASGTFR